MKKIELKERFLTYLSTEYLDQLTPPIHAIIDEAIDSILDGSTIINGAVPKTEGEIMISISQGVKIRAKLLSTFVSKLEKNVKVNYRGVKIT